MSDPFPSRAGRACYAAGALRGAGAGEQQRGQDGLCVGPQEAVSWRQAAGHRHRHQHHPRRLFLPCRHALPSGMHIDPQCKIPFMSWHACMHACIHERVLPASQRQLAGRFRDVQACSQALCCPVLPI